jgi:hypothetical protein
VRSSKTVELQYRVGASVLAAVAGAAVGLAVWVGALALAGTEGSFPALFFGGAAAGFLTGWLFPVVAMEFVEGTLHFAFGAVSGLAGERLDQSPHTTARLGAVFAFGVFYGTLAYLFLW